jgi:hypothetical protein
MCFSATDSTIKCDETRHEKLCQQEVWRVRTVLHAVTVDEMF